MKVLLSGPILGYNKGREKSQAEFLIELLKQNGIEVAWASRFPKRIKRAIDTTGTILRNKDASAGIVMVYSYGAFLYVDLASYLMLKPGIPVIFWLHGGALPEFTEKHKKWAKRVLSRGRVLVAPSEYLAEYYKNLGFNVKIIRNIIFSEKYPADKRHTVEPKLLWMRTFHPLYNPQMALYAFKDVLKEFPDATLTMAGVDRGIMKETMKLAKELGIADKVNFPGFLDDKKKYDFFKTHYIYLHTNNVDNTPVSLIEALASGLIVIGTNVGGIPYLLKHGENALLVNPGDSKQMAKYVINILKGTIDVEQLRYNGRKLAMEFDSKNVIKDWLYLINNIKRE